MNPDPANGAPPDVDINRPNVARMYDYWLGGAHNFQADRDAADAVTRAAPEVAVAARANRGFLHRVLRFALDQGIRQFLDLGSGIPTVGSVHEIAGRVDPRSRVVYVDNEPVAVAQARAMIRDLPTVAVIEADLRDTDTVLGHPATRRLLRFDQPVAVLLVSVLHFVPGDAGTPVAALRQPMSPGSLLVLTHASSYATTTQTTAVLDQYSRTPTPIHLRSREQIAALFHGLHLVDPHPGSADPAGLVPIIRWRPDPDDPVMPAGLARSPFLAGFLAGVATTHAPPADGPATRTPARRNRDPRFPPAAQPTSTTPDRTTRIGQP